VQRLNDAYEFLYPERVRSGYRPDAVDFFSLLKAYMEIGEGLPGGLADSRALLTDLKFALANVLIRDLRDADDQLEARHGALHEVLAEGNVVITLNWDTLIERYAFIHGIPIRLSGTPDDTSVLLLKLHGSIDWTLRENCKRTQSTDEYAVIRERLHPSRQYTIGIDDDDEILRIRALENWSSAWRHVKSRTDEPFMITMSQGKASDLERVERVWQHAYFALSAATSVELIGYSMPHDDIEVRALLRAGINRGSANASVTVRNPAHEVHEHVRSWLLRDIRSNYVPFPGYT
jgi:hypothetical protein